MRTRNTTMVLRSRPGPPPRRVAARRWAFIALALAVTATTCVPEEPQPPPPEEFPEPAQPSWMPAADAEPIAVWDFGQCPKDWTVQTLRGTPWECGAILRGPGGDRTGEGNGWGVGMTDRPAGRTETMLTSPPVFLDGTNVGTFTLAVWHWLDAEALAGASRSGGGVVEVFDGGTNRWVVVEPYGGYDGIVAARGTGIDGAAGFTDAKLDRVWRRSFFDLSPWAGEQVQVRFHAGLGTLAPGDGWFLDDVRFYRGGVVEDAIDTDLSTCRAGDLIRFPFRTCDEGFGQRGTNSSWACGPATTVPAYPDAPLGDGPQFDVDDSGLSFATAPSGLHGAFETSELVSPAMDLSGCQGRTTSLSFWHWYQFGPGAGGWVEVWDGEKWLRVSPLRGYGGPVPAAFLDVGGMNDGFVTADDRPSGWRFEVFDVSAHVNAAFRVRFRFFAGMQRRPGWYIDTVAVSTFALEDLPRLDGDPKKPGCGFGAVEYVPPDFDAVPPDPCVAGKVVVPAKTVYLEAGGGQIRTDADGWSPGDGVAGAAGLTSGQLPPPDGPLPGPGETVEFDVAQAGAICVEIINGTAARATRVAGGRVLLDAQEVISSTRFDAAHTLVRERVPVTAGKHTLVIAAGGMSVGKEPGVGGRQPGVHYTYHVRFQAGAAMPVVLPPAKPPEAAAGREGMPPLSVTNLSVARGARAWHAKLGLDATAGAYGGLPGMHVARYAVQVADARTCRQMADVRRVDVLATETLGGLEEAVGWAGVGWVGGRPSPSVYVRIFALADVPGVAPWRLEEVWNERPPAALLQLPFAVAGPSVAPPAASVILEVPVTTAGPARTDSLRELPDATDWRAPFAAWEAPHRPFFALRRIEVLGSFPSLFCRPAWFWTEGGPIETELCESYRVRLSQDAHGIEWWAPGGPGAGVLRVVAPPIGNARGGSSAIPVSADGGAELRVYVPRTIYPAPPPPLGFLIRPPRFEAVLDPFTATPPPAFYPAEDLNLVGNLLDTFAVEFQIRQGTDTWPLETVSSWEDTSHVGYGAVSVRLPSALRIGEVACIGRMQPLADSNPPLGAIGVGEFCLDVVAGCTPDEELDQFVPGQYDTCRPFEAVVEDRQRNAWCDEGEAATWHCPFGCESASPAASPYPMYPGLSLGRGACRCVDSDFGNPYEAGVFGSGTATYPDRCEGDVLIETTAPATCFTGMAPAETRIACPAGCEEPAGRCACPETPVPIVFGCLPFDWPVPPAGWEAWYGAAFAASCRALVARFAQASDLAATRCYHVVPMWFPEHWAEHPRHVGSDQATGNPSWEYGPLNENLVLTRLFQYWLRLIQEAVHDDCTGPNAYLCEYRDVNVFIGLAAWQWAAYRTGGATGSGLFHESHLYPALIALPRSVVHELGHVFGWLDSSVGAWRVLCEEYGTCAYRYQQDEPGVICANDEPPSSGWDPTTGWVEDDGTCLFDDICADDRLGRRGCLGAPLFPGAGPSRESSGHCFMGHGTGGFCGYCRAHLREAFGRWTP